MMTAEQSDALNDILNAFDLSMTLLSMPFKVTNSEWFWTTVAEGLS